MLLRVALAAFVCLVVSTPYVSVADPPSHAPAHGYRNKTKEPTSGRVEVVFDSTRGVRVVVGLPGVFFEAGKYYRHVDGHWHVSTKHDGGWSRATAGSVPRAIAKTRPHHVPAKIKPAK